MYAAWGPTCAMWLLCGAPVLQAALCVCVHARVLFALQKNREATSDAYMQGGPLHLDYARPCTRLRPSPRLEGLHAPIHDRPIGPGTCRPRSESTFEIDLSRGASPLCSGLRSTQIEACVPPSPSFTARLVAVAPAPPVGDASRPDLPATATVAAVAAAAASSSTRPSPSCSRLS